MINVYRLEGLKVVIEHEEFPCSQAHWKLSPSI